MEIGLAVPLSTSQIEAANELHKQLSGWQTTDGALHALHIRFPGFDDEAALLKVAAVNQLYGTNVFAVGRMAEHIRVDVMSKEGKIADVDFVEELATLPEMKYKHISFASKFAHFFVNAQRFPIYDSVAISMIEFHLGKGEWVKNKAYEYCAFIKHLDALMERARPQLSCSYEALDRYLWLTGLYKKEKTKATSEDDKEDTPVINREVWRLFKTLLPDGIPISPLSDMLPPQFANLKPKKSRVKKGKKQ